MFCLQLTGVRELQLPVAEFNKLNMLDLSAVCQNKMKWDLTQREALPDFLQVDGDPLGSPLFQSFCSTWLEDMKSGHPRRHILFQGLLGPPLEEIVFFFRTVCSFCFVLSYCVHLQIFCSDEVVLG